MKFELFTRFKMSLVGLVFIVIMKNTQAYYPSEMVSVTVYYETLCPASRSLFFNNKAQLIFF